MQPNLKNKRCFILGGGPNLQSADLSLLDKEITIGVNNSYRFNPILNFANDRRFYDIVRNREDWVKYQGLKIFAEHHTCPTHPEVIRYPVIENRIVPKMGEAIYPGNNSGFGAIQLAIALGFKQIYLLGFDMEVDKETNRIHWHEDYIGQNNTIPYRNKKLTEFKHLIEYFAPLWFSAGIDIQLCTPSALQCFERISLEKAVNKGLYFS